MHHTVAKGMKYAIPFLVAAVLVVVAGVYVVSRGFSARDNPNAAEVFIARQLRHMAVPRGSRQMTNPVPAKPEVLEEAMEHFADHCATCHANDGSGNTAIGKGLYPKPPDMRQAGTQNLSDGELYYIIHNGVRFTGMPAFGPENGGQDDDSWKLVRFIRHLPDITEEELARMKEMNPKSPADLKEEDEIKRFLEGGESQPSEDPHKHHH
jgi:mono/diheme cytochrome c family protein